MARNLVVDGFSFENQEAYNDAQKEAEAISYLSAKTDMNNAANIVKLYNKLIDKQTFVTPVGISFMKDLYDRIIASGIISKENLRPVPVKAVIKKQSEAVRGYVQEGEGRLKVHLSYTEGKLKNSRIMNIFLIVIILAMFAITMFGDRSPLIDSETRIQNKYAEWEENLTEREKAVTEKERELGIK